MKYRKQICEVLTDMGLYVCENEDNSDFSLQTYIVDSINFITFIVMLEEKIGFTFPDEFLSYDIIDSIELLSNTIQNIVDSK